MWTGSGHEGSSLFYSKRLAPYLLGAVRVLCRSRCWLFPGGTRCCRSPREAEPGVPYGRRRSVYAAYLVSADDRRKPLTRYGAMEGALRERFATVELHHYRGRDPVLP